MFDERNVAAERLAFKSAGFRVFMDHKHFPIPLKQSAEKLLVIFTSAIAAKWANLLTN